MTLLKVEGVSNDVFIPEEISQEDQNFLLERTENIVGIVARAKVEIGIELLKVEQRFRQARQFSGKNGWYVKWCSSIGLSDKTRQAFTNAASNAIRVPDSVEILSQLPDSQLKALSLPNFRSGNTIGGSCTELVQAVCDARGDGKVLSDSTISSVKASSINQVLAAYELAEQVVDDAAQKTLAFESSPSKKTDEKEYFALREQKEHAERRLDEAQAKLDSLSDEQSKLEAKYDDWRSPEAIKQELDEAIEKARAEERAKKAAKQDNTAEVKAMKELHLKEVQENQKLKERLKELESKPAPEPDMAAAKAIAKAELEGEVAVKIKEIEMRTKQQLAEAEEKVRKAEAAKKSAQNSRKELQDELELAQKNTPKTPEWVLGSITQNISDYKESCIKLENIKRTDGKSNEFTDLDEYAVEAFQQWFNSFTPDAQARVIEQLQSGYVPENTLITTEIIDV